MKKIFENYYKIPDSEYTKIWDNAIFVLDTNILLNLFRYPESARTDFLKVLKKIKANLWIPFIAGLEFFENVESVKNSQLKAYSQIYNLLEKTKDSETSIINEFINSLKKLNLDKRHFEISEQKLIENIKAHSEEYLKNINSIQNKYLSGNQNDNTKFKTIIKENDKLMSNLESILRNKIGSEFNSQDEIDKMNNEAKTRYNLLIPPGYKDSSKNRDSKKKILKYKSLNYKREYCDFYIWNEIIQMAKEKKNENINLIFITDDAKEDWWRITSGKTVGPRIELIDEIKSLTNNKVKNFLMYNSWRFLEFAIEQFNLEVKEDTLPQIKLVQEKLNTNIPQEFSKVIKVYKNYLENTKDFLEIKNKGSNKFTLIDIEFEEIFYDVRIKFSEKFDINSVIKNLLNEYSKDAFDEYQNFNLVIIEFSKHNYTQNKQLYLELSKKLPEKINVISHLAEYNFMSDKFSIII